MEISKTYDNNIEYKALLHSTVNHLTVHNDSSLTAGYNVCLHVANEYFYTDG